MAGRSQGLRDQGVSRVGRQSAEWREFLAAWWDRFQGGQVGVEELYLQLVGTDHLLTETIGDGTARSQRTKFGIALRARRGRIIGGWRIRHVGEDHRARQQFRLERVCGLGRRPADLSRPFQHPAPQKNSSSESVAVEVGEVSEVGS